MAAPDAHIVLTRASNWHWIASASTREPSRARSFADELTVVLSIASRRTSFAITFADMEVDGEIVVPRVPPVFLSALAKLSPDAAWELARRWSAVNATEAHGAARTLAMAAAYLESVTVVARVAIERGHELFLWTCP